VAGYEAYFLAERDIAVLLSRKGWDRIDSLCRALRRVVEYYWISNEADPRGEFGRRQGRG
jgi:hypothetical protein